MSAQMLSHPGEDMCMMLSHGNKTIIWRTKKNFFPMIQLPEMLNVYLVSLFSVRLSFFIQHDVEFF